MGVIRSGILSKVSGKVAGVVGAHWKDKAYLREYVIPSNPNTGLQQVQRALMIGAVAFAKNLVGQIFKPYTDKFIKSMSGFNKFISDNISCFTSTVAFSSIKMTAGNLWPCATAAFTCLAHTITITWDENSYGNNGAPTDAVYAAVYDATDKLFYFPSSEKTRTDGTIDIGLPATAVGHVAHCWVFAGQYSIKSPTLLEMISNSAYVTGTVI